MVAANVRAVCGLKDWTQADVARALHVGAATVNIRWRGQRQWQLEDLAQLAAAMDVPVERFFARLEGFEPPTFWLGEPGADKAGYAPVTDLFTRKAVA